MEQLKEGLTFENRFQVLSYLGGGAMGAVYKAKQLDANRIVALKLIHPSLIETDEFRKRFLRECKLLSQLSNDHIITFYHAAISEQGYPYAVFEYLDGQTLRQLLNENRKLGVSESIKILIQATEALQAAHALGIIHRDLKPENLMISQRPGTNWMKVFDFGLSKSSIAEERESQKLTLTGDIVGTAAYMSPEQCRGGRADAKADIYALGCIAFECLTGKPLFDEDTPMAALHKHLNEDPTARINELCSFCPPSLTGLVSEMLEKTPSRRPRSMASVREALVKAEMELKEGVSSTQSKKITSKHKSLAIAAFLTVTVLVAAGTAMFVSLQQEQSVQRNKLEKNRKRAKKAVEEQKNFTRGSELIEIVQQELEAQNYKKTIELARECADIKNDTCEYMPVRLRAYRMWAQAANFSGLANPEPPLQKLGELVRESDNRHCLPSNEQRNWKFNYLLLATNVNQTRGRYSRAIALTEEFERLHNQTPEDEKQKLQFVLTMISRGHAYRNSKQYDKAVATDQRALKLAKELKGDGADLMHSIYPSLFFDLGIGKVGRERAKELAEEYSKAFEEHFNSANSEGMMRSMLAAQDNILGIPQLVDVAGPMITTTWRAAEMFPEISTHLRMRSLQQFLHLRIREAKAGKIDPKVLRGIANSYLRVLKEANRPSLGPSYFGSRDELAAELEALLSKDSQAALANKVKQANESFRFDK